MAMATRAPTGLRTAWVRPPSYLGMTPLKYWLTPVPTDAFFQHFYLSIYLFTYPQRPRALKRGLGIYKNTLNNKHKPIKYKSNTYIQSNTC